MSTYRVDFKTRAEKHVTVIIGTIFEATEAIPLTPADTPLTISEEGKEDLFVPIKCQSGYVEVITDDFNLIDDIIPEKGGDTKNGVYVFEDWNGELNSSTSECIWMGFVQPKLLDFTIWNGKQKLRIPIMCRLSALKYRQYRVPSNNTTTSIYRMLWNMLATKMYFQGGMVFGRSGYDAEDKAKAWMRKRLFSGVFSEGNTEYDVLSAICTFFGWTCRSYGEPIYFIANRNVDAQNRTLQYTQEKGSSYDEGHDGADVRVNWEETVITGDMLASNKNTLKFYEGVRKATATCALDSFESSVGSDFAQLAAKANSGALDTKMEYSNERVSSDIYRRSLRWLNFNAITAGNWTVQGSNVYPLLEKEGTNIEDWKLYIAVIGSSRYQSETLHYEPEGPGSPTTEEKYTMLNSYQGLCWFTYSTPVTYETAGILTIKIDTGTPRFPNGDSYAYLNMKESDRLSAYIRIGNREYSSTKGWTTIGNGNPIFVGSMGGSVPVTAGMTGKIEIGITNPDNDPPRYTRTFVTGFNCEYTANQDELFLKSNSTVTRTASNGSGYEKTKEFDVKLCTREEMAPSVRNYLLNPDDSECEALYDSPYVSQPFNPLQRLCDEAVQELRDTGRMLEITVMWRRGIQHDIKPITMIYVEPLKIWAYPVAVSYNFRDDTITLKLIKRKYADHD